MKISVLIAAYRAGPYIAKALESIRAQTHADWEVVVVEDGSRDDTANIVSAFAASAPQSVRYENLEINRGVAVARSRLLSLAQGDAAAFIDADDWWTPRHLENASRHFEAGADVVVAGVELYDLAAQKPQGPQVAPEALVADPVRTLFATSAIVTSSCVALRKHLAEKVGNFDSSLRIGEDRDYWLRCSLAGAHFALSGENTCFYAKHSGSTMAKTLLWAEQSVRFYEKYSTLEQIAPAIRRRALAHELTNYGRLLRRENPSASRQALLQALRLDPRPSAALHYLRSLLVL